MSDYTFSISSQPSNPLPVELLSSQVTALEATDPANPAGYSSSIVSDAVDLGTVSDNLTAVVTVNLSNFVCSDPSIIKGIHDFLLSAGYQATGTPAVGSIALDVQGSLDGSNWYTLAHNFVFSNIVSYDGTTLLSPSLQSAASLGAIPLVRYIKVNGEFHLNPTVAANQPSEAGQHAAVSFNSLTATTTAYVAASV